MYSQLISDGEEPHRASGARSFKTGVALSVGIGFLVGAIVVVSLCRDTSTAESSNLVVLPISRGTKGPFFGMGIKQVQQSNAAGLPPLSAVHRVSAEIADRYAKPPHDPFYGVGAKQVRQSNTYAGLPPLPTALPSLPDGQDRYAKGSNDPFPHMGMGMEVPSAPFPVAGREVTKSYAELPSLPAALHSSSGGQDRYAKGSNDPFPHMGTGMEVPSAPFPVAGRDVAKTYAELPSLPTALHSSSKEEDRYAKGPNDRFTGMGLGMEVPSAPFPLAGREKAPQSNTYAGLSKNYASLGSAYGARSKEAQESTIEFESLRV